MAVRLEKAVADAAAIVPVAVAVLFVVLGSAVPLVTEAVLEKPAPAGSDEAAATTSTKVSELPEAIAA